MLNKVKIGRTLLVIFLLMGACQLAIGVFGFTTLKTNYTNMKLMNGIALEKKAYISDSLAQLIQARLAMVRYAFATLRDGEGKADPKLLDKAQALMVQANTDYEKFHNSPKFTQEGQYFDTLVSDKFTKYHDTLAQMFKELKNNDLKAYSSHSTDEVQDGYIKAEYEFSHFAVKNGNEAYQTSVNNFYNFQYIWCGSLLLLVLSTILSQIWVNRAIVKPLEKAGKHFEDISQGDLTQHIDDYGTNEVGKLFSELKNMQTSLTKIVQNVLKSSDGIYVGAQEIAAGNQDLSQRTEEQAASLEETAASMDQMTSTVSQNTENAKQANKLAHQATEITHSGATKVQEVVAKMQSIAQGSAKISEITGVIESIAFQTNILALNAAVEAARAGAQGRGFAVVAGEVRSLANRCAEASKEIKTLLGASNEEINQGSEIAKQAGQIMNDVKQSIQKVEQVVHEISVSSEEQSVGINQVNQAVSQMDTVTQQNAALVEEAAAAASSLHEQTNQLNEVMSFFKLSGIKRSDVSQKLVAYKNITKPVSKVDTVSAKAISQPKKANSYVIDSGNGDWNQF